MMKSWHELLKAELEWQSQEHDTNYAEVDCHDTREYSDCKDLAITTI